MAGRPTLYEPLKIAKAVQAYVEKRQEQKFLPTIEGLAVHLMVSRECLYEWARVHPEFSDILEQLKAAQADQLIQNGLVGYFNATITKLMLSKHGYKDASDITSGDKPITPLSDGDREAITELRDLLKQRAA
jgi:hypothetical protein